MGVTAGFVQIFYMSSVIFSVNNPVILSSGKW